MQSMALHGPLLGLHLQPHGGQEVGVSVAMVAIEVMDAITFSTPMVSPKTI